MASKGTGPDLNKHIDKHIQIKLQGNRVIQGILRGFDQFLNLTLEEAQEINNNANKEKTKNNINYPINMGTAVIRGNSVLLIESLEKII
jgi:small nuclear ribonucleoprotein G